MVFMIPLVILSIIILSSFKMVYQYQRGVKFTLGKYSGIMNPGLRLVIPILQTWRRIDIRTWTVDVPEQDAMTKDNVSVMINAVLYYKVTHADLAVLKIEEYDYALSQLAQTTMRDVTGEVTLDQLLSSREEISNKIQDIVDKATDPWGIKVSMVELKDIKLPSTMIRTMAKEAEAERERRAVIIKAQAELDASHNMTKAAHILLQAPGSLHLRTLQSLNDISSDQTNTIVFTLPLEYINAMEGKPIKTGWAK
jgi:regulator of protease activity HflC (stomatin/prohibitin superfamily)